MKNNENSIFSYNSEDVRSGEVSVEKEETPRPRLGKGVYIAIVAVVSVLLSVLLIFSAVDRVNEGLIMELPVGDILPYTLADGSYSGTFTSNDSGAAVTITIESGYLTSISLDAFSGIDTSRAQRVFDAVIQAQSLVTYDRDVGTTPTDIILLLAIENAAESSAAEAI